MAETIVARRAVAAPARRRYIERNLTAYAFVGPALLVLCAFIVYPAIYSLGLSFFEWSGYTPEWGPFVGFDNYLRLWNDPVFWQVFGNTFKYLIIGMPISLVLSFLVAYYLDQVRFLQGAIRALYFIPFLTTAAAMAWVWRWFYQPVPIGIFNLMLVDLGFTQQPFLRSTTQALGSILATAQTNGTAKSEASRKTEFFPVDQVKPGMRATFSFSRGLCFMVHEPSG